MGSVPVLDKGSNCRLPAPSSPPPSVPSAFGILAAQILAALSLGMFLLASHVTLALVMLGVIAVLAFDTRNVLILKNFFLTYMLLVFGVGGGVLHLTRQPIYGDMVLYTLAFLAAYALFSVPTAAGQSMEQNRAPLGKGPIICLRSNIRWSH